MKSLDRHEAIYRRVGGQTEVSCRCALMDVAKFNIRADAERAYCSHVEKSERAGRRPR